MVHAAIRLGQNRAALDVAPSAVTLDPANTSAGISLSVGNLRATRITADRWVSSRVTASRSGALIYFEATNPPASIFCALGLVNAAFNVDDGVSPCLVGIDNNSAGLVGDGNILVNGVSLGTSSGWQGGQVGGFAVNQVTGQFWARGNGGLWNGSGAANPATGAGGFALPAPMLGVPLYAAVSVFLASVPNVIQINLGATAFAFATPAGFGPY